MVDRALSVAEPQLPEGAAANMAVMHHTIMMGLKGEGSGGQQEGTIDAYCCCHQALRCMCRARLLRRDSCISDQQQPQIRGPGGKLTFQGV